MQKYVTLISINISLLSSLLVGTVSTTLQRSTEHLFCKIGAVTFVRVVQR